MSLGLLARYGLTQVPAGGGGGGPDGTDYYVTITVQSSQVSSTLTSFPVYVSLADMPAAFWTNVQSDGGDIRVTENDGTTRVPVELVSISTGTSTGELHFLASSLSASTDTVYRLYYGYTAGGSLAQPGVATTYGRNAVWADYEAVLHMQQDPSGSAPQMTDSTGNGSNGTTAGTMTSGDSVAGKLAGQALELDGSDDYVNLGAVSGFSSIANATASVWVKMASTAADGALIGIRDPDATQTSARLLFYMDADGAQPNYRIGYYQDATTSSFTDVDTGGATIAWQHAAAVLSSGTSSTFVNGSIGDTSGSSITAVNSDTTIDVWIGREQRTGMPLNAQVDEVRIRASALSAAWLASEYTNQNTPTTFYAVGAQTTA